MIRESDRAVNEQVRSQGGKLALGVAFACAALSILSCGSREPANVILIVVDTLRADRLGAYGGPASPTPTLDRLARQGLQFRSCVAQSPWTTPSLASILTGHFPSTHGADWMTSKLSPAVTTLAEHFQEGGWRTGAFVSHRLVGRQYDFDRGFDKFDQTNAGGHLHVSSRNIVALATRWIARTSDRPFFALLHFFDPHYNYVSHRGFTRTSPYDGSLTSGADIWDLRAQELDEADLNFLRELYDGEIRFLDAQIGRLLQLLERRDLLDNTIVALTADHGEEFLEHGWLGHTVGLYQGMLEVPLIVHAPARLRPSLRNDVAMGVDVTPTLLPLAGADRIQVLGQDLVRKEATKRFVVAEVDFAPRDTSAEPRNDREATLRQNQISKLTVQQSIQKERWKAIYDRVADEWSLYDLESDPGEQVDLADEEIDVLEELEAQLEDWARSVPRGEGGTVVLSPEDLDRLRALGYTK